MTQAAAQTSTRAAAPASPRIHIGERLADAVGGFKRDDAACPADRDADAPARPPKGMFSRADDLGAVNGSAPHHSALKVAAMPGPAADEGDRFDAVASHRCYRGLDRLGRAVAAMGGVEDLVAQTAAAGPNLTLDLVCADRLSVLMSLVLDELRTAEDELLSQQKAGAQTDHDV